MKKAAVDCGRLQALHQRTIAVQFALAGRDQLLLGRGTYQRDRDLGQILRIELAGEAGGEILLAEDDWNGEIRSGEAVGSDFLIRLN